MEPLKNLYNRGFFTVFVEIVKETIPALEERQFLKDVFDQQWETLELKQRMRHISSVLKKILPGTYEQNLEDILRIIHQLKKAEVRENSLEYMFFPDFIEQFGQEYPELSLAAMEEITQFTSCEFAIRPFLLRHQELVMKKMLEWSQHSDHRVRRFATEGCRPRLPWAMAIPQLKKDPAPILPILENLKDDRSEFVRRSVANNLNDIAKDHPGVVLEVVKKWQGHSKETDWVIKHGCRTLLRKADPDIFALFGLSSALGCQIENLQLENDQIQISDQLHFSFTLSNGANSQVKLRVEYAIHYIKATGKQHKKLFKITENYYQPGQKVMFRRSQSFRNMTTRKHYPGQHKLSIVINGVELAAKDFMLSS